MGPGTNERFSYQKEKEYYSKSWPERPRPHLHLRKYLKCFLDPNVIFSGKKVLEIGAGECQYANLFGNALNASQVIALELFPERMRPAFLANSNPKIQFVAGDCYKLSFQSSFFDIVFGNLVLHHLPQLEIVIEEIARVLKPGGLYCGIEPNRYNVWVASREIIHRSANEYLLHPKKLQFQFLQGGISTEIGYFWARFPFLRGKFLTTSIWIIGTKE